MTKKNGLRVTAIAGALMFAMAMTGCSSESASTPAPSISIDAATTIVISNYGFSTINVKPGAMITVVNKDGVDHSVNVNGTDIDPQVGAGETKTFKAPTKPGSYKLTCDFHQAMRGTLTVGN
jgi:plastocyanin